MEWISVEDRLPELKDDHGEQISDCVLVVILGGSMFVAWRDGHSTERQQWESDNGLPEDPTHWISLPEPPK